MKNDDYQGSTRSLLDADEVQGVLSGSSYAPPPDSRPEPKPKSVRSGQPKPDHYKVICISLYTGDLLQLDQMVDKLKARGLTKANRSALIRYALEHVDLDKVPKGIGLAPPTERMQHGPRAHAARP